MNADVPVLQDELNRKAIDTLIWLVSRYHTGQISLDQFSTGVDTLFIAVSGCVTDRHFMPLLTKIDQLIKKEIANGRMQTEREQQPAEHQTNVSPGDWR